ncbi:hypothetical protein FQN54_007617 [Arachnomyces sp. PD_36]|nr:hypothetical protein FQN54_007617 [Arachnomyces sp. PD_36]
MSSSDLETFIQQPLHLDPTTKSILLHPSAPTSSPSTAALTEELDSLNTLHRTLLTLETPTKTPPPPIPLNPKRSAQITKLRDSANTAYRKSTYQEAIKLYTFALDMALARPPWEPASLVREESSGLFANRAQAYMAQRSWAEGLVDAKSSVECKGVGNVKGWWRAGKCLAEMGRWAEAKEWVEKGLEAEVKSAEAVKELNGLLEEVKEGLARESAAAASA